MDFDFLSHVLLLPTDILNVLVHRKQMIHFLKQKERSISMVNSLLLLPYHTVLQIDPQSQRLSSVLQVLQYMAESCSPRNPQGEASRPTPPTLGPHKTTHRVDFIILTGKRQPPSPNFMQMLRNEGGNNIALPGAEKEPTGDRSFKPRLAPRASTPWLGHQSINKEPVWLQRSWM